MFHAIVLYAFLLIIGCFLLKRVLFKTNQSVLLSQLPGPCGWPLIKNANEFITGDKIGLATTKFVLKYSKMAKYMGVFKMDLITEKQVYLNTPESAQAVLASTNYKKGNLYDTMAIFLGNGLTTSDGKRWQYDRKALTEGFHRRSLDNYFTTLNLNAINFAQQLEHTGTVDDLFRMSLKFSLDSVLKAALEVYEDDKSDTLKNYSHELEIAFDLAMQRMMHPLMKIDLIYRLSCKAGLMKSLNYLTAFANKIFETKRSAVAKDIEENGLDSVFTKTSGSILQCLMKLHFKDQANFGDQAVIDHLNTFISAGNDSTAVTMCMTLYHLAKNANCQNLLHTEVSSLPDTFNSSDISGLVYLDAVLKESLRVSTVLPFVVRNLENDLKVGEYIIPKHTDVTICIEAIHLSEQLYQDATKFQPERWLAGNEHMRSKHAFAYLPFSAGPRNCIGKKFVLLELKLALIHIVKNLQMELLGDKVPTMEFAITTKPVSLISMVFKPRAD